MSCFYRNQKVTLTRRQGSSTVTAIYDNASTVTIEDYKGSSFLMIQYMDKKKLYNVRYNCSDIISFILTAATPKIDPKPETEAETEYSFAFDDETNETDGVDAVEDSEVL